MIIQLIKSGHRASEISESLNINKSTISYFLKRWRERGNVENRPRKGRPRFVTDTFQASKNSRRTTLKDITADFNNSTPIKVSRRTVHKNTPLFGIYKEIF